MDDRKAYEIVREKGREGKGGGGWKKVSSSRPPLPFFGPGGVPAGRSSGSPQCAKSLNSECTWTSSILVVILSRRERQ